MTQPTGNNTNNTDQTNQPSADTVTTPERRVAQNPNLLLAPKQRRRIQSQKDLANSTARKRLVFS